MRKRNKAAELNLAEEQLEEVERMLIRRWEELKPEWEIVIISLPKNDAELRKKILDCIIKQTDDRALHRSSVCFYYSSISASEPSSSQQS